MAMQHTNKRNMVSHYVDRGSKNHAYAVFTAMQCMQCKAYQQVMRALSQGPKGCLPLHRALHRALYQLFLTGHTGKPPQLRNPDPTRGNVLSQLRCMLWLQVLLSDL